MKNINSILTTNKLLHFGRLLVVLFYFILSVSNIKAQYHIAWTRTFSEGYPSLFYPVETKDGFLIPLVEYNDFKVVKLNTHGKLLFKKEALTDSFSIDYRDFFPTNKGQIFHQGFGMYQNNTRPATCLKKVDKDYNTKGFDGLINKYQKPCYFFGSAGNFEFSDSSVAFIELANIEKSESAYPDLVFSKYDKNSNLVSSYINKDWHTAYYDNVISSTLRWKTFTIDDTTLVVYGGHRHKDSLIGANGFLILNGKGIVKDLKDELDILNLRTSGKLSYTVLDVAYYKNRFYIYYYISLLNNVSVNIQKVLVCNSNFDSLTAYDANTNSSIFKYWPRQNELKIVSHNYDSISNPLPTDFNQKLCFSDTLSKTDKCFKLKDILGKEFVIDNRPENRNYNLFSIDNHMATYDGGLLLIFTRDYPVYDSFLKVYISKNEDIVVKISPGNGLDTIGHEADTNADIPKYPKENAVILFPNPNNTNLLNINTDKWQSISVYNVVGQLIKTYTNTLTPKATIDISTIASGNYFLKIVSGDKTIYSQLVRY